MRDAGKREREKGEEEAATIGSALEKPFFLLFFSLKRKNWDAKPVVSFVRCGQRHLGFLLSYFSLSITRYWPVSVGSEWPVRPLCLHGILFCCSLNVLCSRRLVAERSELHLLCFQGFGWK